MDENQFAKLLHLERDLALALSTTNDMATASAKILEAATQIEGMDCGGIYVADRDRRGVSLLSYRGLSADFVAAVAHCPADAWHLGVVDRGESLYRAVDDLPPGLRQLCRAEGLRAVAIVPVVHQGRVIAVLNLASRAEDAIPPPARNAIELIAVQAGGVMVRAEAAASLRDSQIRYQLIADHVADVIFTAQFEVPEFWPAMAEGKVAAAVRAVLDHWKFLFISPAIETILGYTAEEAQRMSLVELTTARSYAMIFESLKQDLSQPWPTEHVPARQHVMEVELVAKDGSLRWCEVACSYLPPDDGRPPGTLGIVRDISQRRRAELALRESEAMLRSLFENLPDLVLVVDQEARVQFANRDARGASRDRLAGESAFDFMLPEHRRDCQEALARALASGQTQTVESQDVDRHWWSSRIAPLAGDDASPKHAMVICTDITQERVATEAVQKEQQLLRQLLDLHERERQLTAYEIHDGFAQQLTGALFRLQAFRETHARNSAEAWSSFDAALGLVCRAIDETRRLISGLRPPILDESGIIDAIQYLAYEHQQQSKVDVEFEHHADFRRLAPPLETAIFRIVQESLQNACRHSQSKKIRVELSQRDGRVHIDVRDWGIGFDFNSIREKRFGLQGIRERVRLLDGRVVIASVPNQGTHIAVDLPLIAANGEPAAPEDDSDCN